VAVRTSDLAGQLVFGGFGGWVVPLKVVMTVFEVDVVLVEDGSPLERCGWREKVNISSRVSLVTGSVLVKKTIPC